ncbi:MAG: GntR family transcriptional regulator [Kiritimatiellae bacterium]|nr:GntR family transcriptional regulator [Kiritimatiellia bacterium]
MSDAKYSALFDALKKEILSGKYASNEPFPSVRGLIRRFGLSDRTVRHALDELFAQGLISREQGRGTFVTRRGSMRKIGLVVPGTVYAEFFQPIVGEISRLAQKNGYTLLFGNITSASPKRRAAQAKAFAKQLVKEGVAGVIFQPLEFLAEAPRLNAAITAIFDKAGVPLVLIDYDIVPPPGRSGYDLVGINNHEAGFRLANHLLSAGAKRIHFMMRPDCAWSVHSRMNGVATAMAGAGKTGFRTLIAEADDLNALRRHLRRGRPDAFVCANDTTAAKFKLTLERAGLRVPADVMLAGFDDIQLASLMTPPLTTIHQPCAEIGAAAFETLFGRIDNPSAPAREIYLPAPLVIRESAKRKE